MDDITILILGKPGQAQLDLLKGLDSKIRILLGGKFQEAVALAPEADVMFAWAASRDMLQAALPKASRTKWIHGTLCRPRPRHLSGIEK